MELRSRGQTLVNGFSSRATTLPRPSGRHRGHTGLQMTQRSSSSPTPSSTTPETAHVYETCGLFSIPPSRSRPGWTIPSAQSLPSARSYRCFAPFSPRRLPSYVRPYFRCDSHASSDLHPSHLPFFVRSVCGITRAAASGAFAPPVFVCTR
jgi:hypothetical protein